MVAQNGSLLDQMALSRITYYDLQCLIDFLRNIKSRQMRHFCRFLLFWSPNKVFIKWFGAAKRPFVIRSATWMCCHSKNIRWKTFSQWLDSWDLCNIRISDGGNIDLRPLEANDHGLQGSQHSVLCQSTSRTTPICIMSCLTSSRKYMHYCASTLTHLREKIYLLL